MTNPYKQLTDAATLLEKHAEALDAAAAQLDQADASVKQAKTAADAAIKQAKTASAVKPAEVDKAKLGGLAKTAAHNLREAGLLSSQEKEDVFASEILDHQTALNKLAQMAKFASAPKRASVVVDEGAATQNSADSVWESKARSTLVRLNLA